MCPMLFILMSKLLYLYKLSLLNFIDKAHVIRLWIEQVHYIFILHKFIERLYICEVKQDFNLEFARVARTDNRKLKSFCWRFEAQMSSFFFDYILLINLTIFLRTIWHVCGILNVKRSKEKFKKNSMIHLGWKIWAFGILNNCSFIIKSLDTNYWRRIVCVWLKR